MGWERFKGMLDMLLDRPPMTSDPTTAMATPACESNISLATRERRLVSVTMRRSRVASHGTAARRSGAARTERRSSGAGSMVPRGEPGAAASNQEVRANRLYGVEPRVRIPVILRRRAADARAYDSSHVSQHASRALRPSLRSPRPGVACSGSGWPCGRSGYM
jgi:hypothetical protein